MIRIEQESSEIFLTRKKSDAILIIELEFIKKFIVSE